MHAGPISSPYSADITDEPKTVHDFANEHSIEWIDINTSNTRVSAFTMMDETDTFLKTVYHIFFSILLYIGHSAASMDHRCHHPFPFDSHVIHFSVPFLLLFQLVSSSVSSFDQCPKLGIGIQFSYDTHPPYNRV